MKKQITLMIALCVAILTTDNTFAQLVTSGADDGSNGTLRKVIADTPAGGIILFAPSVSVVTLNSELLLDKAIIITGISNSNVIIDADEKGRAFNITAGPVVLNNLTITNGLAANGGGIYVTNALLTMNSCMVNANTANAPPTPGPAGSGGGIFNDVGGILLINDTQITSNTANRAGGGIEDKSGTGLSITLNNVDFTDNKAGVSPAMATPGNGGALHISGSGSISIIGGTISGNMAAQEGGGLWNGSGTMTVSNVEITDNVAQGDAADDGGGGIFNNGGVLNVQNGSTISNNVASGALGSGGGIFSLSPGTLNIDTITISGNTANRAGGGIEIVSAIGETYTFISLSLTNNTATGNGDAPGNGGGFHISGSGNTVFTDVYANSNQAVEGGALWNGAGSMIITGGDTELSENEATGDDANQGGGALYNDGGTMTIDSFADIYSNIATGISGSGGAILSTSGTLNINLASLTTNGANRAGGGIEIIDGTANLFDLQLISNDVNGIATGGTPNPGNGGGLHVSGNAAVVTISGIVFLNEAASEGGGLWNNQGSMEIQGGTFFQDTFIDTNNAFGVAADNGGGGIFNNGGTLTVNSGTNIVNNVASGSAGSGGGVFSTGGTVTITEAIITDNVANRAGGGIELAGGILNLNETMLNANNAGVSPAIAAPGNGGGLHVTGSATTNITGGTTNNNTAANEGGGLWNGSGMMTIIDHVIDTNIASGNDATITGAAGGGGIYNEGGMINLSGSTAITKNIANGAQSTGGGILNAAGTLIASGISIAENTSNRAGGGIETNGGGVVTLTNVNLNSNETGVVTGTGAPGNGGGLHVSGNGSTNVTGGTVNLNTAASEGGGLWNGAGTMTVDATLLNGNNAQGTEADNGGGALFNNGGIMNILNGTVVSNNLSAGTSGSGGGLLSTAGAVTILNSTFDSNSANRAGGAIELIDGTLDFTNSTMSNNDVNGTAGTPAPGNGGGFHVTGITGIINIASSNIVGNEAFNDGGGLWNQNGTTMNVINSALYNNVANEGGAIYGNTGSISSVMTSTISGNSASISGGGISNNGASFDLNAVTIALNTSATGGGIDAVTTVSLKNSIVALNTAASGADVSGILSSNDYNLIGSDNLNVFSSQANDLEGVDPLLGPLQDNGGTTFTHELLVNSPAFDAGAPEDDFDDQIGQVVFGATRDIGAYESQVVLGLEDFNAISEVKIYPNPTKGQFSIALGNNFGGTIDVQIVSINGQLVKKLTIGNGVNAMDISGMASGLYIINIKTENSSTTHKLILD